MPEKEYIDLYGLLGVTLELHPTKIVDELKKGYKKAVKEFSCDKWN